MCRPSPAGNLESREFEDIPEANNITLSLPHAAEKAIDPRAFNSVPGSRRFGREMRERQLNSYLPNVIGKGHADSVYGPVMKFSHGDPATDERAVMRQAQFRDELFQWGTGGLCGCTMVTLVSRRAVWMAHFWETFSHADSDWVPGAPIPAPDQFGTEHMVSYRQFQQRILRALRTAEPPANPVTARGRNPKGYIAPEGPPIDPKLFNDPEDGTELHIMTPYVSTEEPIETTTELEYANRIEEVKAEIADILGIRPMEHVWPYRKLRWSYPDEYALVDKTCRGFALFQYDPDADGDGNRGWRIMYESKEIRKFLD
ncbi:uncharacterized protein APUU_80195A [Aspergillus puulaauensis]|uniref:Uncharacterized protein n=1 Tax=Aspergillus puulaauensis TaxID=1220207 RepID=A0A7R8AT67_9EURO|nr:uncharacterized protein APUU_80195A [Aspergillus puulaauensis]BCS29892.1 hypothetical protein APUU_80195A [Aspergillus puulaauensis]